MIQQLTADPRAETRPPGTDAVREAVAAEIAARFPRGTNGLDDIARYALQTPGKLLRPLLVCHSALAFGADLHQVLPAAAGLECAHVGSLVHDDILDGDLVRRGKPTVQALHGPRQAILAGSALYFTWFAALADCAERGVGDRQIRQALAIQARAGAEACRGASAELDLAGDMDSGAAAYLAMAGRKTAALLAAACQVGAALADAPADAQASMAAYGEHLGLAFQIRDDLLPYADADGHAGKPRESDLRNRRPTLPVLLALDMADACDRQAIRRLFAGEADDEGTGARSVEGGVATGARSTSDTAAESPDRRDAHRELRDLVRRCGAAARTRDIAEQHAALARAALADLPPGPHVRALEGLTRAHALPQPGRPSAGEPARTDESGHRT
ncbi:polyprenyl synthetase family protein [Streptodolium elevatio]|uniref:Polyprenyl synthetase family protein n=1 Tax=Streptodolium elevatio TaxID=3157996 RepID=A0ABV3DJX0_9ACTN